VNRTSAYSEATAQAMVDAAYQPQGRWAPWVLALCVLVVLGVVAAR
jgi:hypothetical protein